MNICDILDSDPSGVPPVAAMPVADEPAESGKRRDGEGREEGGPDPERRAQGAVSKNTLAFRFI